MKRILWKELCNKLNFASKTNCKSFEVTPIIRTVYITHPSPVHLCLSPFCVWLPLGYGNWRNSHESISISADDEMKRILWKELCNKLNFASKTNCKSFEVTPIIRTVYITHPSPVHLCLSPFCVWLPLGYGNWRNSHESISTAARLNERILCPFFNMEGLFKSGTQNKKLNMKEAAAITPKQHLKNHVNVVVLFTAANWSKFYENFP